MSNTSFPPQSRPTTDRISKPGVARNPVSLRLYKIIGTNHDDNATRKALDILSELYQAPDPDSKAKTHSPYSGAVKEQATYHPTTSLHDSTVAKARRNLKRDVESRATRDSREFLRVFKQVNNVRILSATQL